MENKLVFGIDSATLTIPLSGVEFPNARLDEVKRTYIESTGEEIDIRLNNSERHSSQGISTYYTLQKLAYTKDGQMDVLKMTINAKQLKQRYLEGITASNIADVYRYHMELGYFKCSFDHFLSGWLTDVDFKIDVHFPNRSELLNQFDTLRMLISPKLKALGESAVKVWNKDNNKGIEFYKRKSGVRYKGSVSPKHQNTRIYLKGLDLLNTEGSYNFYKAHLEPFGIDAETVLRVETWGGKNSKQFASYGVEDTTLSGVLDIDLNRALPMFQLPLSHFMDLTVKQDKPKHVSLEDVALFRWLSEYLREGVELTEAIEMLIAESGVELSKQNRYKKRQKIEEVFFRCQKSHGERPVQLALQIDRTFKKTFLP